MGVEPTCGPVTFHLIRSQGGYCRIVLVGAVRLELTSVGLKVRDNSRYTRHPYSFGRTGRDRTFTIEIIFDLVKENKSNIYHLNYCPN